MSSITRTYAGVRFREDTIRAAHHQFREYWNPRIEADELWRTYEHLREDSAAGGFENLNIATGRDTWSFDTAAEFFDVYRVGDFQSATVSGHIGYLTVMATPSQTSVSVSALARHEVLDVLSVFDRAEKDSHIPVPPPPLAKLPNIFIGHGGSPQWTVLRDELRDKHKIEVTAFETGERAGHTVRDVLEEIMSQADLAVIVFTAEDEQADSTFRARQNVVHEAGLFAGRLGSRRTIMVVEDGVELFSNVAGIVYVPFPTGQIKSAVSDILAVVNRRLLL